MLSNSIKLLVAGFVMGWGPCLTYTAPLLLPYVGATRTNWQGGLRVALVFSIGRLLALALLGGLATVAFGRINQFFPPQRSAWLYAIAALFMIAMGGLIIVGKGLRMPIGNRVLQRGTESMFLFGFLMGVAPVSLFGDLDLYRLCSRECRFGWYDVCGGICRRNSNCPYSIRDFSGYYSRNITEVG